MNILTCYIIDDELHAIKNLQSYIEKTPWLKATGYNLNPLEALAEFQQSGLYPAITFLDIEMPKISGIEMASHLQGKTAIIFTTAHPGFALEAFELGIYDYLLKPFSYQRFLKSVTKIQEMLIQKSNSSNENPDDFIYIQTEGKGKVVKVLFKDIIYIESKKNYVSIVTAQKNNLTYLTLTEIEQKLPPGFLRVNKSFIIDTEKISHVEGNEIFLIDLKESFVIGTSYKDAFNAHMKEHLIKSKRT